MNDSISESDRELGERVHALLLRGSQLLSQSELDRRYRAALRCRERLISIPFYAQADKEQGMTFWLNFQGSAALADE